MTSVRLALTVQNDGIAHHYRVTKDIYIIVFVILSLSNTH